MTMIYGNVVAGFTQDLSATVLLKTGVRAARRDRNSSLVPQHVIDTYFLSNKYRGSDGQPGRMQIGDGNVLLAAQNSDVSLYVGMHMENNVGFGVSVETGGTKDKEGEVYVTELYFPAERRNGWVYGYIDRSDQGKTLRVKPKKALSDAAQALWKVRVTMWPIIKWEGQGQVHDANAPPKSIPRLSGVGTGGLGAGQQVGDRETARHTRVVEFDRDRRVDQTFYIMTGSDDEVTKPVQQKP